MVNGKSSWFLIQAIENEWSMVNLGGFLVQAIGMKVNTKWFLVQAIGMNGEW